jgi:hypothetical protein
MLTTTRIKDRLIATVLAAGLAIGMAVPASEALAQTPTTITYQGVLNKDGSRVNEEIEIAFLLFDAAVAGNLVGGPIFRTLTPEDGVFTEALDFGAAAFAENQPLWLEMQVSSVANPSEMDTFREPLSATPFALNTRGIRMDDTGAAFLNRLRVGPDAIDDGSGARNFVVKRDPITQLYISMQDDNTGVNEWEIGGNNPGDLLVNAGFNNRIALKQNGSVGIGTTTPATRLDVNGEITLGNASVAEQGLKIVSSNGLWEIGSNNSGNGTSNNQFYIYEDIANFYALTVQRGSGHVGIGTQSPIHDLQISRTGSAVLYLEADTNNIGENDHPRLVMTQDGGRVEGSLAFESGTNNLYLRSKSNTTSTVNLEIVADDGDIKMTAVGDINLDPLGPSVDPLNPGAVNISGEVNIATGNHSIGPTDFSNVALTIDTPYEFGIVLIGSQGALKPGGGSWGSTSDRRLKKNIEGIEGALDTLLELRGVHFEYKDPTGFGARPGVQTGFVAQEVETVIPDWIGEMDNGIKTVTIRGFEALAVEAMRELKAENEMLRERLDMLEALLLTEKSRD